jgi:hypothetical protein
MEIKNDKLAELIFREALARVLLQRGSRVLIKQVAQVGVHEDAAAREHGKIAFRCTATRWVPSVWRASGTVCFSDLSVHIFGLGYKRVDIRVTLELEGVVGLWVEYLKKTGHIPEHL